MQGIQKQSIHDCCGPAAEESPLLAVIHRLKTPRLYALKERVNGFTRSRVPPPKDSKPVLFGGFVVEDLYREGLGVKQFADIGFKFGGAVVGCVFL